MITVRTRQIHAAQYLRSTGFSTENQSSLRGLGTLPRISIVNVSTEQWGRSMLRSKTLAVCAILSAALATPAAAASETSTRLVKCGSESCLRVSGQRPDKASAIVINGHEVSVKGAERWHVRMPVETVRAWSSPFARTIAVSVAGFTQDVKLPIGMMGHGDLAMLVVRAK